MIITNDNIENDSTELSLDSTDPSNIFPTFQIAENIVIRQPFIPYLQSYMPIFLSNAQEVEFRERWNYAPSYCSYDMYQTTNLYWLIMYINNCPNMLQFNYNNFTRLLIPPYHLIDDFFIYILSGKVLITT